MDAQQITARGSSRRRGSGCSRGRIEQIQRRVGRGRRSRGSGGSGGGGRSGLVAVHVKLLVGVVPIVGRDAGHLGNDGAPPGGHGLAVIGAVHPHGHTGLVAIGTGDQRTFEAKVVATREGEGTLDLTEGRRRAGMGGLGSQKDVGVRLAVAVFRNKVSAFCLGVDCRKSGLDIQESVDLLCLEYVKAGVRIALPREGWRAAVGDKRGAGLITTDQKGHRDSVPSRLIHVLSEN